MPADVAGDELLKRLTLKLSILGRACDEVQLRASAAASDKEISALVVHVQVLVLNSGRWHAAAGFVHAVGAAALVHVRRAHHQGAALNMVAWLWNGNPGAERLGPEKAFLGLRGLLSYGSDMKTAASPVRHEALKPMPRPEWLLGEG